MVRATEHGFRSVGQTGMTLVEVLVATVVLALSAIGLFRLGSMSTTGNTRNADQIAAASLANAKLEDLRNTDFDSLAAGADGPLAENGTSGGIFSRSWTVTDTAIPGVSTPAKILTATVTWTGSGSITMTTMVVKPSQVVPGIDSGFPTASIKSMVQTQ